jgi:hypothetical protein
VLVVSHGDAAAPVAGVESVVRFSVEGVIVGGDRSFDHAEFVTVRDDDALAALVASTASAADAHVLVVDRAIDRLVASVATPTGGVA